MTIEELNKLIKEELDAYLSEEEAEGDIEVTTDEPAADTGEEAMDLLRQIYDLIKPEVEPTAGDEDEEEAEVEDEDEVEDEVENEDEGDEEAVDENMDRPNYKAEDVKDVKHDAEKIKGGLKESFDGAARFKKLANING